MIAASRTYVQQHPFLRCSLDHCGDPRMKRCVCVYVCKSPEVSCPGGCLVAPPKGPERQRQPLLKTRNCSVLDDPWRINHISVRVEWKEFQWRLEQHWDMLGTLVWWTLVPQQNELFPSKNQEMTIQSKQEQTLRADQGTQSLSF